MEHSKIQKSPREFKSSLGKALGMGSSKKGISHWKVQRLTGLGVIPLSLWFIFSLGAFRGRDWGEVIHQVGSFFPVVALILLMGLGFYHSYLGMQVVIEDYVSHRGIRFWFIFLLQMVALGGALCSWVSLIIILMKSISS